jgi:hypothetical protein
MLRVVTTEEKGGVYYNSTLIFEYPRFQCPPLQTFFKRDGHDWFFAAVKPSTFVMVDLHSHQQFLLHDSSGFHWQDVHFSTDGNFLAVDGMIPNCESEYVFYDVSNPTRLNQLPIRPDVFLDSRGELAWTVSDDHDHPKTKTDSNDEKGDPQKHPICIYEMWRSFCTKFNKWERNLTMDEMFECYDKDNQKQRQWFEDQLAHQYVFHVKKKDGVAYMHLQDIV